MPLVVVNLKFIVIENWNINSIEQQSIPFSLVYITLFNKKVQDFNHCPCNSPS
jgi:hypothetical protein